ncbi:hypothetical protein JCM9279_002926 [Rhodotorula babjevae]
MDDTVTIRTADDPPVELKASRVVLMAGSKVFADIFDVAETEDELEPFLKLLNIAHEDEDPLAQMCSADWPVVARLAEKYDSAGVKALAVGRCWQWQASAPGPLDAVSAFLTARALKEQKFTTRFLYNAIDKVTGDELALTLADCEPDFTQWVKKMYAHAIRFLLQKPPSWTPPRCSRTACGQLAFTAAWLEGMRQAINVWPHTRTACAHVRQVGSPFSKSLNEQADGFCQSCRPDFQLHARTIDAHYRLDAPDFPL